VQVWVVGPIWVFVLVRVVGIVPQIIIYFKKQYTFHVEDENPWIGLDP